MAQLLPGGKAVIDFSGASDPDSGTLTYKVYRDGGLIKTIGPVWAHWWNSGLFQARDSGLGRSAHTYRVDAVDAEGNAAPSGNNTPSTTGVGYRTAVLNAGPSTYWRLN